MVCIKKKQSPVSCTPTHWAAAAAALTVTQHLNVTVICALVSSNRNTERWPDIFVCEPLIPAANQARFKSCEYTYRSHFSIYINSKLNSSPCKTAWYNAERLCKSCTQVSARKITRQHLNYAGNFFKVNLCLVQQRKINPASQGLGAKSFLNVSQRQNWDWLKCITLFMLTEVALY